MADISQRYLEARAIFCDGCVCQRICIDPCYFVLSYAYGLPDAKDLARIFGRNKCGADMRGNTNE